MAEPNREDVARSWSNQREQSRQHNFKPSCFHEYKGKKFLVDKFYSELYWEHVYLDKERHVRYQVWRINQDDHPCPMCNKSQDVEFNIQAEGICYKCQFCGITSLVVVYDPEKQVELDEKILDKEISLAEGVEICKRIGQNDDFLTELVPRQTRRRHEGEE